MYRSSFNIRKSLLRCLSSAEDGMHNDILQGNCESGNEDASTSEYDNKSEETPKEHSD
jgi:hypothetical protein